MEVVYIHSRTQNVNRNHNRSTSSDGPSTKKSKFSDPSKHAYPVIPDSADDDESVKRNFSLLSLKSKPWHEVLNDLLAGTSPAWRRIILGSTGMFVADILTETPNLKKGTYVRVACWVMCEKFLLLDDSWVWSDIESWKYLWWIWWGASFVAHCQWLWIWWHWM